MKMSGAVILLLTFVLLVSCGNADTLELIISCPAENTYSQIDELLLPSISDTSEAYELESAYTADETLSTDFSEEPYEPKPFNSSDSDELSESDELTESVETTEYTDPIISDEIADPHNIEAIDTAALPESSYANETIVDTYETESVAVILLPENTETEQSATPAAVDTVYWVKNGEVWHIKSSCPSLSRSKNILSGSVSQAKDAGKLRVCKRCGDS